MPGPRADGAALTLLDRLLVREAVEAHLRRESMAAARAGGGSGGREVREAAERELWERLAARIDSVPGSEYERLRPEGEHPYCVQVTKAGRGVSSTRRRGRDSAKRCSSTARVRRSRSSDGSSSRRA